MLDLWQDRLERRFADEILPVTPQIADRWGRLQASRPVPTGGREQAQTGGPFTFSMTYIRDFLLAGRVFGDLARLLNLSVVGRGKRCRQPRFPAAGVGGCGS